MNLHIALLAVAIASVASPAAATPPHTGALGVPANTIAGVWASFAAVAPCGSPPPSTFTRVNTLLIAAGGGVVENPRIPPGGVGPVARSIGLGGWSYNPTTAQYRLHLQFDWYLNGAEDGYQTVDRTIILSGDGRHTAGPVQSTRYAADGSVVARLCGRAMSERL